MRMAEARHGLDPSTNLGPLISDRQFSRVSRLLQQAWTKGRSSSPAAAGSAIRGSSCGQLPGQRDAGDDGLPRRDLRTGDQRHEDDVDHFDELAREANNTEYGLAASIWTKDLSIAHRLAARIRAGIIWVNNHNQSDANVPWGGVKQSGWGREMGKPAIELYTELKSVVSTWLT